MVGIGYGAEEREHRWWTTSPEVNDRCRREESRIKPRLLILCREKKNMGNNCSIASHSVYIQVTSMVGARCTHLRLVGDRGHHFKKLSAWTKLSVSQHRPHSVCSSHVHRDDAHARAKGFEGRCRQALRHHIGVLLTGWNM